METEQNDTLEAADTINLGQEVQGSLSSGVDHDVYKFGVDGPGGINISMDVPDASTGSLGAYGTWYWIDLLRSDGSVISTHGVSRDDYYTDGVAKFSAGVEEAGDYFVRVGGPLARRLVMILVHMV